MSSQTLSGLRPYFKRGPLAVLLLGLSSGFPLALVLGTLTYWLSKVGIQKSTVGLFALAGTPYILKFLWSPFLDRAALPFASKVGQRRMWLWCVQLLLVGALIGLGFSDPATDVVRTAIWVLVVAFLSASQDILIDAYRIEILEEDELAYGSAMINFGARTGMLIGGAGTVWLSTQMGWAMSYSVMGLMVLPGALAALWIGEPKAAAQARAAADTAYSDAQGIGSYLNRTLIAPFRAFLQIEGALLILVFVAIYKVGDAMANTMVSPLIVELGFTDDDYIFANKVVGFWALIAGTALGAPLLDKLGMARALFFTGLFMMVTNLMFAMLATSGASVPMLAFTIGLENFSSGVGLAVFVTYISGLCNLAFTGTHYALLSSVASLGRTFVAASGGVIAEAIGWVPFFVVTTFAAVPGLGLLWLLWRRGYTGESARVAVRADKAVNKKAVIAFMGALITLLLIVNLWRYIR